MRRDEHTESVSRRFSAAAADYDSLAWVQKDVAARLMDFIPEETAPDRILEAGCGSGQLTQLLLERFPSARIDSIDVSEHMIHEARTAMGKQERLLLHVADTRTFEAHEPYSLIASSSALHWVVPFRDGVANLYRLLEPGGALVASVMVEGTLGELHEARRRTVPDKPPATRMPTGERVLTAMADVGFHVEEATEESRTARYPSARVFLTSIHGQGLTGGAVSRAARPLCRSELDRLIAEYDAHYPAARGGVRATFRVLFVRARKTV